ncbi:MAG: uroporphyrinogen-III synthase [Pseudomonadota bacterium]
MRPVVCWLLAGNIASASKQSKEIDPTVPPTIIITRPRAQAKAFADALEQAYGGSLPLLIAPLMEIEHVASNEPIGTPDHLIFTSANAVGPSLALGVPMSATAWCVGDQTAALAQQAGFAIKNARGDSQSLITKILSDPPAGRFLHLHGAHVTGQIAQALSNKGVTCDTRVVYDQVARPATPALIDQLAGTAPLIIPIFSPRSARLLAESAPIRAPMTVVAISDSVASAFADIPGVDVKLSNFPDKTAMIAATLRAFGTVCGRKTP